MTEGNREEREWWETALVAQALIHAISQLYICITDGDSDWNVIAMESEKKLVSTLATI